MLFLAILMRVVVTILAMKKTCLGWFVRGVVSLVILSQSSCEGGVAGEEEESKKLITEEVVLRVACGSCYKTRYKHSGDIWPVISSIEPDLFLFMGDNIYSDTHDMNLMRQKYAKLNGVAEYVDFRKKHELLAVWDDHDYGVNDAGEEFAEKVESQKNFFDAFGYAVDHPARKRKGIYHSKLQGPEGKRLQIINLDTRYHRSALKVGVIEAKSRLGKVFKRKYYKPNTDAGVTMLGEEQWEWLEKELAKESDLCLIVTSIQFITEGHIYEKWANLPKERQKMIDLLKRFPNKRVIFLSGDRHLAEVARLPKEVSGLVYELVEMTTSGMTHAGASKATNKYRVEGSYYNKVNFGSVEIDWPEGTGEDARKKGPVVRLLIHDRNGKVRSTEAVDFK